MTTTTRSTLLNRCLLASAAILVGVFAIQVGLPESRAFASRAGMNAPNAADVSTSGDYTMLTLAASNEDLLLVLDGRNESLFVYRIRNKNTFELIVPENLQALFARGQRIGPGAK